MSIEDQAKARGLPGQPESVDPAQTRPRGLIQRLARGRGIWALGDQALISGTNFATMILVARALNNPTQFGYYGNVNSVLLFAALLPTALITQPHNVLGTARFKLDQTSYARYTTTTAFGQLILSVLLASAALLLVPISRTFHWQTDNLLIALAPSIVAWQLQEFVRRVLYSENRTGAAFLNDIVSYGGQTALIAALWWRGQLTAVGAMYILAATSAAAVVLGFFQIRSSLAGKLDIRAWKDNWNFGKWLVGSEILTYLSSIQMYMILAAGLVGAAASGELKAAQTLFGPARVISFFLATVLPIQFAQALTSGEQAMHRQFRSIILRVLPGIGAYCLLTALFAGPLLLLFGRNFAAGRGVLELYSVVAFLTYAQTIIAAALTARHQTRFIFAGSVCGAIVALTVGVPSIKFMGVYGALTTMLLTAVTVTLLYWKAYRSTLPASEIAQETPGEIADSMKAHNSKTEVAA